jgi:hypothetical protein
MRGSRAIGEGGSIARLGQLIRTSLRRRLI